MEPHGFRLAPTKGRKIRDHWMKNQRHCNPWFACLAHASIPHIAIGMFKAPSSFTLWILERTKHIGLKHPCCAPKLSESFRMATRCETSSLRMRDLNTFGVNKRIWPTPGYKQTAKFAYSPRQSTLLQSAWKVVARLNGKTTFARQTCVGSQPVFQHRAEHIQSHWPCQSVRGDITCS